jgi:hypothetical protein
MASLYGSLYDLPLRGLPRELGDEIYLYALYIPQSISMQTYHICGLVFRIISRNQKESTKCKCSKHTKWRSTDSSETCLSCPPSADISIAISLLFVNRQMSLEALLTLDSENTFQFSACSKECVEDFADALRPASVPDVSNFFMMLSTIFKLDTLAITVILDSRPAKSQNLQRHVYARGYIPISGCMLPPIPTSSIRTRSNSPLGLD